MPIPKGISNKKRGEWHELKPHVKRPDLDNLVKTVCDALNGIAFEDDSALVQIVASKIYSENPRTEITLEYF